MGSKEGNEGPNPEGEERGVRELGRKKGDQSLKLFPSQERRKQRGLERAICPVELRVPSTSPGNSQFPVLLRNQQGGIDPNNEA